MLKFYHLKTRSRECTWRSTTSKGQRNKRANKGHRTDVAAIISYSHWYCCPTRTIGYFSFPGLTLYKHFGHCFIFLNQLMLWFYVYECLSVCMSVCHMHAWCLQKSEKDVRYRGTTVTDVCKPSCRWWGLNPGSLQKPKILLTTEPALQLYEQLLTPFWVQTVRQDGWMLVGTPTARHHLPGTE